MQWCFKLTGTFSLSTVFAVVFSAARRDEGWGLGCIERQIVCYVKRSLNTHSSQAGLKPGT